MDSQTDPNVKKNITQGVISGLTSENPEAAAAMAAALPPGDNQRNAITNIANNWANDDPVAAAQWATKLPPGESRNTALRYIAGQWAETDPASAAKWAQSQIPVGDALNNALSNIASNWAENDPSGAAQWSATLPAGDTRTEALGSSMRAWVEQDPDKALSWFSSNVQTGKDRDTTIVRFWSAAFDKSPQLGIQWMNSISDPALRATHYQYLAKHWMKTDPATARTWISSSPLITTATKQQLLSAPNP
jgi:uncharacterized protein YbdZ (MbtH family)